MKADRVNSRPPQTGRRAVVAGRERDVVAALAAAEGAVPGRVPVSCDSICVVLSGPGLHPASTAWASFQWYPRATSIAKWKGGWPRAANPRSMRTPSKPRADLERWLLRRGIGALVAGRSRCSDCHRTPLVGERIHVYESGQRGLRAVPAAPPRGRPCATERVRGSEAGHAVRLRAA